MTLDCAGKLAAAALDLRAAAAAAESARAASASGGLATISGQAGLGPAMPAEKAAMTELAGTTGIGEPTTAAAETAHAAGTGGPGAAGAVGSAGERWGGDGAPGGAHMGVAGAAAPAGEVFGARDEWLAFGEGLGVWAHRDPRLGFSLPVVGGPGADYAPAPRYAGRFEVPTDQPLVCFLPVV